MRQLRAFVRVTSGGTVSRGVCLRRQDGYLFVADCAGDGVTVLDPVMGAFVGNLSLRASP